MGRRKSVGAASALGWAFLLVLGLIVTVIEAGARFVQENWPAIQGLLVLAAIALGLWRVTRLFRRAERAAPMPGPAASVSIVHEYPRGQSSVADRQQQPVGAVARWVQPGEVVRVQGFNLSFGLFYLGEVAPRGARGRLGQYVVSPRLKIGSGPCDVEGTSMPYWPSYDSVTPNARAAFLQWMGDGRRDPRYGIGHVFLFFYGLEHRLFVEDARAEAPVLIAEVERLLSIYGQNNSFRHYAVEFLFAARLFAGIGTIATPSFRDRDGSPEISSAVRLHMGRLLASNETLGADDAFLWATAVPNIYLRTPAIRCGEEFKALWRVRFAEKYPDGLRVRVPKKRLQLRYRAASGAFEVPLLGEDREYPDIGAVSGPVELFKKLVQSCTDELDAYSRFVGRNPDNKSTIQAALLLPPALHGVLAEDPIAAVRCRMSEVMGTRATASMQMRKILEIVGFEVPKDGGRLQPAVADQLSSILDLIDYAVEPDRRYGAGTPQPNDEIFIFSAERGGPVDPYRDAYRAARVRVEVAILAAAADGQPSVEELETVMAQIRDTEGLSKIEIARLLAYSVTLFKSPPKQDRIVRRLAERPEADREAIARAAIGVVGANGHVGAREVRFLEKLSKTLKVPKENVYDELHRSAAAADEPVTIMPATWTAGVPIPKRLKAPDQSIRIDAGKLARVKKDTQAVSALLSKIFADDERAGDQGGKSGNGGAAATASPFSGLDTAHAELVEALELRGDVSRREFEERAGALKLLPDGAIETINEWSFEHFDEPLLEDGDRVIIAAHLRGRLSELRTAS